MKRQIVIMISIATVSFLIGTMFSTNYLGTSAKPPSVWDAINELQAKVNSLNNTVIEQQAQISELQFRVESLNASLIELQESLKTKTWHLVTDFILSNGMPISPLFYIQGEKWRIIWEPQVAQSGLCFWVYAENGLVLDYVDIGQLLGFRHGAKGIHYVSHGEGSYFIETSISPGNTIDVTIESYH